MQLAVLSFSFFSFKRPITLHKTFSLAVAESLVSATFATRDANVH
jgi:hypothetical protein